MLLPGMRQTAPCKRAVPRPLRTAENQPIAATAAFATSRRPRVQLRRLRERCRQQRTLSGPRQPAEEGPVLTSPATVLRHAGSLPIRWLLQTPCGRRLLRRPRRPILRRPPVGPALQAQDGMRLPWLHETPLRTRVLPRPLAATSGKAAACTPSRAEGLVCELEAMSMSWNPCIPMRRRMAMLLSTQKSWPQDSADLWSPSRKSIIRTVSAATTGQRISNYGPEVCNHLGVASAT